MEVGLVTKIDIDQEMQQAYLDYAMSVIVARALPDARDGLKPVHRRILYAMYDMGMRPDSPYKKSARIVGEVLGKYHPHGDQAVYDSMARMAQDFSMRYTLVDGQGNFGSLDDDPPAAMRYTEARLTAPAMHILADIAKNTVDFTNNFDGTLTEPSVLPSAIPNLLVNGATGIAVGMATSIPPHNLVEIANALQFMLENYEKLDDIGIEDLMEFVQGPDFPTGGVIIHSETGEGLMAAYSTGRGQVTLQARAHLEEMERGRNRIIVTELPYLTYKAPLIARIAELVRDERLEGIVDLRDESDRQGMRILIELNKTADPEAVLRDLYKHTPMQITFSINMLALVGGEPRLLSLKQALRVYIEHRLEIVRRRSEYELERARSRAHILEGLRIALKNLDEIIDLIRRSPDTETAHTRLMKKYRLSDIQAQAILDMPLKRLAALERKKIEEEYKEVVALIKSLEALLHSSKKMRQVISEELAEVSQAYGDRRRTHIVGLKEGEQKVSLLTSSDLLPDKKIWVAVTAEGLVSRTHDENMPRLSGKEAPLHLLQTSSRDTLYLVSEQGETAAIPVHAIPEVESPAEGTPVEKVSPLEADQRLAALFCMPPRSRGADETLLENWYVITATRQGMVKRSALSELPGPSANTFTLARVNEGDQLGWLRLSEGKSEILLLTARGMAIRFSEEEVRPMGLVAAGVMGIKLDRDDQVAGMDLLPGTGEVFMVAADGSAKRVKIDQFPKQGRYGQGVVAWKLPSSAQVVGLAVGKGTTRAILHLQKLAPKAIRLDEAPLQSRLARGAAIQEVKVGDQVLQLTLPWEPPQIGERAESKPAGRTRSKTAAKPAVPAKAKTRKASQVKPAAEPVAAPKRKSRRSGATQTVSKEASAAAVKAPRAVKSSVKVEAEPAQTTGSKTTRRSAAKTEAPSTARKTTRTPAKVEAAPAPKTGGRTASKSTAKTEAPGTDKKTARTPARAEAAPAPKAKGRTASKSAAKTEAPSAARRASRTPAKAEAAPAPKTSSKTTRKSSTKTGTPGTAGSTKATRTPAKTAGSSSKTGAAKPSTSRSGRNTSPKPAAKKKTTRKPAAKKKTTPPTQGG
jgi:DNA gyrase subunit A